MTSGSVKSFMKLITLDSTVKSTTILWKVMLHRPSFTVTGACNAGQGHWGTCLRSKKSQGWSLTAVTAPE